MSCIRSWKVFCVQLNQILLKIISTKTGLNFSQVNLSSIQLFVTSPHTLTKIWDYFSIYHQKLSSLSLEERNSMVKKYYRELNVKFHVSGKIYLLLVFLFLGFLLLLLVVVAIAVKEKVSIFCVQKLLQQQLIHLFPHQLKQSKSFL